MSIPVAAGLRLKKRIRETLLRINPGSPILGAAQDCSWRFVFRVLVFGDTVHVQTNKMKPLRHSSLVCQGS